MAKQKSSNEVFFRQWFACVYGYKFGEPSQVWQLPDSANNIYRKFNMGFGHIYKIGPGSVSEYVANAKLGKSSIRQEVRDTGTFDLYLGHGDFSETLSEYALYRREEEILTVRRQIPNAAPAGSTAAVIEQAADIEVELKITEIGDMKFPDLPCWHSGSALDMIFSDLTPQGGVYGGSVYICTGESGVGKSTVLQDYLMKLKFHEDAKLNTAINDRMIHPKFVDSDPETQKRWLSYVRRKYGYRPLYISSEMTATDISFYRQKMPAIDKLPTMLVSDYTRNGKLLAAITKAFNSEYNMILLDSYQDMVEKMKDILGWPAKQAENFLIDLMIDAAEKHSKAVIAIQHLTKGGTYVGSTYLKHTTTGMITLRFDSTGQRYIMFEKNRRGGSMINMPLYFSLDKENKCVQFAQDKFEEAIRAAEISAGVREDDAGNWGYVGDMTYVVEQLQAINNFIK